MDQQTRRASRAFRTPIRFHRGNRVFCAGVLCVAFLGAANPQSALGAETESEVPTMVQAGMVFTVAESKRLIAKAVVEMPIVQNALRNGKVVVAKGTTNTYIAEELLGQKIEPGAFVFGRIRPQTAEDQLAGAAPVPEVVLVKGQHVPGMTLDEAMQQLEILADVAVFQAAAGGIGGAEGGVWLIVRGDRQAVQKALELAEQIHGEPAFRR